jgi:hypothetical protein
MLLPPLLSAEGAMNATVEETLAGSRSLAASANADLVLERQIERALRKLGLLVADSWMTPLEAAQHARLSKQHLLRVCRQGCGPQFVGEGKLMRFRRSAIDRWLETMSKSQ